MTSFEGYSQEEFQSALRELIVSILKNPWLKPVKSRKAVLLGGQSGAGKSTIHLVYKDKFSRNVIIINGDEYHKLHPHFDEIQMKFGIDSPAHTAAWSSALTEALIDAFSMQGYNLIIEGTLRTSDVPLHTAQLLKQRNYDVSLAIMAVKPEISLVSCQIRYEQMRIAGTTARAVNPQYHARIVNEIADKLAALEQADCFTDLAIYNRTANCLLSVTCPTQEPVASKCLREVLFGPWTEEERHHLQQLEKKLSSFQT
ncbi:MAG: zeta toxin family protein [Atopobiaceae bacterium]|nr:zeta toxin family protein [Atopobiaceae bacterium]